MIGSSCDEENTMFACEYIWSGSWCRWDCTEFRYAHEVEEIEPDLLWTISANDAAGDGWDGCHYHCYQYCSVCEKNDDTTGKMYDSGKIMRNYEFGDNYTFVSIFRTENKKQSTFGAWS